MRLPYGFVLARITLHLRDMTYNSAIISTMYNRLNCPRRCTPALAVCLFGLASQPVWPHEDPPPPAPARDAVVETLINGISRERLEETVRALAAFPTRHTLSGASGADAAAAYLKKRFEATSRETGGRLTVEADTWTQPAGVRMDEPHALTDVIATLPGTAKPERVVVISGHYDSRVTDVMNATGHAPGANDDASGVAVVQELARVISAGPPLPCTIVFANVTGEEQGLYGSTHLAERMVAEHRNVVAMLNNDIVGNSHGIAGAHDDKRIRVFSAGYDPTLTPQQLAARRAAGTDADTPARTLARAVVDACKRYVADFSADMVLRNDRYGRGGDHSPFMERGFAAVRLTEPNEDWRHQHQDVRTENGVVYGDLPEFVDYAYLAKVTQVNGAALAEIASAPESPTRVRLKGDLSATTTLSWTLPTEAVAAEILWRKTTAVDWEGSRRVAASATEQVLPLSKDDYLFAVRSVSATGARSLPTVPVAGR